MFDIGFSELLLVFIIGLIVLGPKRLPVAVKTVMGWIRAMRSLAANVQNELTQELKLHELHDSLKKVEQASKDSLSPQLKASMEELKNTAESFKRTLLNDSEKAYDEQAHTIHNPLIKNPDDFHDGVTPAKADHQSSAPQQSHETAPPPVEGDIPVRKAASCSTSSLSEVSDER